jgi:hypothetical protein
MTILRWHAEPCMGLHESALVVLALRRTVQLTNQIKLQQEQLLALTNLQQILCMYFTSHATHIPVLLNSVECITRTWLVSFRHPDSCLLKSAIHRVR